MPRARGLLRSGSALSGAHGSFLFFFFNDTATTEIYTLSLHDALPIFLLSPVGGTVADRYNRHRVVIATQTTSMILAAILALFTLAHWLTVWELITLASLLGVV